MPWKIGKQNLMNMRELLGWCSWHHRGIPDWNGLPHLKQVQLDAQLILEVPRISATTSGLAVAVRLAPWYGILARAFFDETPEHTGSPA